MTIFLNKKEMSFLKIYEEYNDDFSLEKRMDLIEINSFATGGKTQKTADKDLWDKYKGMKKESVDEDVDIDEQL